MSNENDYTANSEPPVEQPQTNSEAPQSSNKSGANNLGMLCHLLSFCGSIFPFGNVIGPLVLWITKKDEDAFLDQTGKEVINFQISMTIYAAICGLLLLVFIGIILLPIVIILNIVYTIIGAIKASEGQIYKYPFTIRFLQ